MKPGQIVFYDTGLAVKRPGYQGVIKQMAYRPQELGLSSAAATAYLQQQMYIQQQANNYQYYQGGQYGQTAEGSTLGGAISLGGLSTSVASIYDQYIGASKGLGQQAKKEKTGMGGFMKDYFNKHRELFMGLAVAILLDRYLLGGAFQDRLKRIITGMLDKTEQALIPVDKA